MHQFENYNIPRKTGFYRVFSSNSTYINVYVNNNNHKAAYYIYSEGHYISLKIKTHTISVELNDLYYNILEKTRETVKIKWNDNILTISKENEGMEHTIELNNQDNNVILDTCVLPNLKYLDDNKTKLIPDKQNDVNNEIIPITQNEMWQVDGKLMTSDEMNAYMNT